MMSFFCCQRIVVASVHSISYSVSYDQDNALIALYYAYGAYCNETELRAWNCKWCEEVSNFEIANNGAGVVNGNELQAFIGYDPDYERIVLSFRGTDNIQDWIDDLDVLLVDYEYATGTIHDGFYSSWKELLSDGLEAQIQSMFEAYPGSDMLVTGHSLGSALAYIASLDFKANTAAWGSYSKGAIHLITFGSPRWCDQDLASYFDGVIDSNYRIVNEDDIVPTVPYESFGFYHTAVEVRYTSTSPLTYTQCDGTGEDSNCDYIGYSVDDHLSYFGLYESCSTSSESDASLVVDAEDVEDLVFLSTMNTIVTTQSIENQILHQCIDGLDNASKIALFVTVALGWCLALICCGCCLKARHDLRKAHETRPYVQMGDDTYPV